MLSGKLLEEKFDIIHCKTKGRLNISDMNQGNVELLKRQVMLQMYVIKYAITTGKPTLGAETFAIFAIFAHFRESYCLRK